MINVIGWIGNAAFVFGMFSLARHRRAGFLGCFAGNMLYTAQAFALSNWSLFAISVVLGIINICGFFSWRSSVVV